MGKKKQVVKHLNPVAKFTYRFNRAVTFKVKTKYNRKNKKGMDASCYDLFLNPILLVTL